MRLSVFTFVLLVGCKSSAPEDAPAVARKVQCAEVKSRLAQATVEVRGTVAPLPGRDAQVAPQIAGRLISIEVREGDTVTKGQRVARVDADPLEDSAKQADAMLSRANAEAANADSTLKRIQHVVDRGIAPRQEADDATARLASARASAVEAEANARQAHRQVERSQVKSPLDGVVLKVLRQVGELVDGTPATPVVEIADLTQLELAADVPAQDLIRLTRDARATVSFPGLPDAGFTGALSLVAPSVDRASGLGVIRVRLDASETKLPPVGLFGVARIALGTAHDATVVPIAALRNVTGTEGELVLCGADKRLHVLKVQVGPASSDDVEVSGELEAGAHVAVHPVLGLQDAEAFE